MEIARPSDDVHLSVRLLLEPPKRFELPASEVWLFVTDAPTVVSSSLKQRATRPKETRRRGCLVFRQDFLTRGE